MGLGLLPTSDRLRPTERETRESQLVPGGLQWLSRSQCCWEARAAGSRHGSPYPMYCSGWLWWMTILHVGHVLFSSRYFTRQLRQTASKHIPVRKPVHNGGTTSARTQPTPQLAGTTTRGSGPHRAGFPLPSLLPHSTGWRLRDKRDEGVSGPGARSPESRPLQGPTVKILLS